MSSLYINIGEKHQRHLESLNQLQELANQVVTLFCVNSISSYIKYLEALLEVTPTKEASSISQKIEPIKNKINTIITHSETQELELNIESFSWKLLAKHFRNNPYILDYISKYLVLNYSDNIVIPKDILIPLQELLEFENSDIEIRIQILYSLNLIKNNQPLDFLEIKELPEEIILVLVQISKITFNDTSPYYQANINNTYELVKAALQKTPKYLKESQEMDNFVYKTLGDSKTDQVNHDLQSESIINSEALNPTFDTPPPAIKAYSKGINNDTESVKTDPKTNPFQGETTRAVNLRSTSPNQSKKPIKNSKQLFDSVL